MNSTCVFLVCMQPIRIEHTGVVTMSLHLHELGGVCVVGVVLHIHLKPIACCKQSLGSHPANQPSESQTCGMTDSVITSATVLVSTAASSDASNDTWNYKPKKKKSRGAIVHGHTNIH